MWVHYFGPHSPSSRHTNKWAFGEGVDAEYDHEVRFNDAHVGRLLAVLTQVAAETPLLVILTSDHGELFHDKRRLHGTGLQEALVRIPLFIRGPGFERGHTDRLVSLVDLAPTILAATGTPAGGALDGQDLAALLAAPPTERVLLTDTWRFNRNKRAVTDMVGAFDGKQMLVKDRVRNVTWLFDQHEVSQHPKDHFAPDAARHLQAALQQYLSQTRGGKVDLRD
ncbi:MAG: sulfatase-like hydrolase/transferase, partial [Myxococcales bacterium]|nr:sulfatase-like hydrolase/transferase [Myxococcales bacterium]